MGTDGDDENVDNHNVHNDDGSRQNGDGNQGEAPTNVTAPPTTTTRSSGGACLVGAIIVWFLVLGLFVASPGNNAPASPWAPLFFFGVAGMTLCYGNYQGWFDSPGEQGLDQGGSQEQGQTQGNHQQQTQVTQNQEATSEGAPIWVWLVPLIAGVVFL